MWEGGVEGIVELFAFYRCYILRVRVLCRFDAAWLMFRVEPDLAHDQTVNGYLHDTTEEELKGLTFWFESITTRFSNLILNYNQIVPD